MSHGGYKIRDQQGLHFVTFTVVEWVDVFTRLEYAEIVVESLNFCISFKGLLVHGWCIMSNHIHLILSALPNYYLSDILRDFKKFTSRQILQAIENNGIESRKNWMLWIFRRAGSKNKRNKHYQFWRQNNHPKELVSNWFMQQKLNYIHNNPVKAGLVNEAANYRWSSAYDYAGGKGLVPIKFLE